MNDQLTDRRLDSRPVRPCGVETVFEPEPGKRRLALYPGIVIRGGAGADSSGRIGREIGLVTEYHPFTVKHRAPSEPIDPENDPDANYWLGYFEAGPGREVLIRWPGEPVINYFDHGMMEPDVVEECLLNIGRNTETLAAYAGRTRFPAGLKFAVIGRGKSSETWASGDDIKIPGEVAWRPQVSIYLNWTKPVRDDDSEKWCAVLDRRVGVEVLDAHDWDGLMLSTACSRALVDEAIKRCLPILVMDPTEGVPGVVRPGWVRVSHQLSVSGMVLNLLGIGEPGGLRRPESLLVCGLDGDAVLKTAPECLSSAEYVQPLAYYNIATLCAGLCSYLEDLGVRIFRLQANNSPFAAANRAVEEWKAMASLRMKRREMMARVEAANRGAVVAPEPKKLVLPDGVRG